jgi:hypothetical protein
MLQHKQGERELKRSEGDIIKKQQHLRRVMLDYENSKSCTIILNSSGSNVHCVIVCVRGGGGEAKFI